MITKGIIIKTPNGTNNKYTVRIPIFESANNTGSEFVTYEASVCISPGSYYGLNVGDVVFISFEDNRMSKPVIIGKLFITPDVETGAYNALQVLKVSDKAELPSNTTIGDMNLLSVVKQIRDLEFFKDADIPSILDEIDTPSAPNNIKVLFKGGGYPVFPDQPLLTHFPISVGELFSYDLIFMRCYFSDGNWGGSSFGVYFYPSTFINNENDTFSCPIVMAGGDSIYIRPYSMKFFMEGGYLFANIATGDYADGICARFNIVEIAGVKYETN